ncbi:sugar ABC transporter substrate-binding protein [Diplocloster modestus]|uniref:Sugar ABC transporter substrate-binding protein n=1 Tax=Diplocloster modestus TaxID=2850322 RepID=A0ABS6KCU0_9FIRM|nr:sugar ABC transporter substrate-binding protein [Diplocloster modestus]MBU9728331.1 sugar ABC transporter substrate-binding protein [Diplocloster modestus]
MKKKLLALGLVTVMTAACLTGCGSPVTSAPSGASAQEQKPAADPDKAADAGGSSEPAKGDASGLKMAWYGFSGFPYMEEVYTGVEAFAKDSGIEVLKYMGSEVAQSTQNEDVEALVAQGINALSIYPADASGANSLYEEITAHGVNVVNFGCATNLPTPASFTVGTDVKQAAMDAAENLIKMMGEKGNILNVLEVLEDPNTALRKEGVEEVAAKYPDVKIVQEVGGINSQEEAVQKIETALSSNAGNIDGIICTGNTTSVGMALTLPDYYQQMGTDKHIYCIGIDTDETVIKAINDGIVDATVAQNPYGHGYISCALLQKMAEGKSVSDYTFVDTGVVLVTKDNSADFSADLDAKTKEIMSDLDSYFN